MPFRLYSSIQQIRQILRGSGLRGRFICPLRLLRKCEASHHQCCAHKGKLNPHRACPPLEVRLEPGRQLCHFRPSPNTGNPPRQNPAHLNGLIGPASKLRLTNKFRHGYSILRALERERSISPSPSPKKEYTPYAPIFAQDGSLACSRPALDLLRPHSQFPEHHRTRRQRLESSHTALHPMGRGI